MSAVKDVLTGWEEHSMLRPANWHIHPIYQWTENGCSCGRDCTSPGKHPRTRHGLKDATSNPDEQQRWLLKWPNASWAVRTGPESNLVVVDVDPDKGGEATWDELVNRHGFVHTVTARTGSGGWHYYFQYPTTIEVKNGRDVLGPGVDIRGNNGYVLLPGSTHPKGAYEWAPHSSPVDVEVAVLPDWLLGEL